MAYEEIPLALIRSGKEALFSIFEFLRGNFDDHESRISSLETAALSAVPTGAVIKYTNAVVPSGYLTCDGSEVSQATYAALYAVIGSFFNLGTEAGGNFRLPDLRGRIPVGAGGVGTATLAETLGSRGGSETNTLTATQIPNHTHVVTDAGHRHTLPEQTNDAGAPITPILTGGNIFSTGSPTSGRTTASATTGISVDNNTGGGGAHANVQPVLVVHFIVKT